MRFLANHVACLLVITSMLVGHVAITHVSLAAESTLLSTQELKSKLADCQAKIRSVYVDYKVVDIYARNNRFPVGTYLRRIVMAKEPNLFSHETAHGTDEVPWDSDPRRRKCIVDSEQAFDIWITQLAYNWTRDWKPDASLPGSMPGEPIVLQLGLWPLTARPAPTRKEHPYMLRDIAANDEYVCRDTLEEVDGRTCHVLEIPSVDTIWLDVDRGCAMMARKHFSSTNGVLYQHILFSDHREVRDGIWMPFAIRTLTYDVSADEPEVQNYLVNDFQAEIQEIRINDVLDSEFEFSPPPGSLWLNPSPDQSSAPVQSQAHGVDHLDALVDWSNEFVSGQSTSRHSKSLMIWTKAVLAGIGSLLVIDHLLTQFSSKLAVKSRQREQKP